MLTSVSPQKHTITIISIVLYRINQHCVNALSDALNVKTFISLACNLDLFKPSNFQQILNLLKPSNSSIKFPG